MMSRRRVLLAPLALAGFMVAGVLSPVAAQESPTGVATIDVTGSGEAETEASGGILQLIVRAPFTGGPMPVEESKGATPTAEQPEVDEEQVAAVVSALEESGIASEQIAFALQPSGPYAGMFGFGSAVIAAELDQEQIGQIEEIVDAAVTAGTEAGIQFDPVNISYTVADCAAVEREALGGAVADGEVQAQALAEVLGVTLGELVNASKQPLYGAYYAAGPASSVCSQQASLEDALRTYLPTYDPSHGGVVEVYSQVLLSYAIS